MRCVLMLFGMWGRCWLIIDLNKNPGQVDCGCYPYRRKSFLLVTTLKGTGFQKEPKEVVLLS
jgi:hypothetical protein